MYTQCLFVFLGGITEYKTSGAALTVFPTLRFVTKKRPFVKGRAREQKATKLCVCVAALTT